MAENKDMSIYVHIPFCEQKCNYCAFASFCVNQAQIEDYLNDLCQEIEQRKVDNPIKTIYFGGGTPSLLSPEQFKRIVDVIYKNYNVYDNAEFTVEANPNSITEEKLDMWKKLRVNRLSIGVQTLKEKNLRKIGRLHDKMMALEKIKLARRQFDNVSADILVGLEDEDGKQLAKNASMLLDLGVKHISCYLLEVYENTKLYQMIQDRRYKPLDEEEMIASFNKLSSYLQDKGMTRYEISNFAYPGYESKHNLNYWARGEYLGFGLGAHSFVDGKRVANLDSFAGFKAKKTEVEDLSKTEQIEEIIMLGLRCCLGVDMQKLASLGYDITLNSFYKDYIQEGVLTQEGETLFLNPVFYHLSNTIIANLLP